MATVKNKNRKLRSQSSKIPKSMFGVDLGKISPFAEADRIEDRGQ
jgi:hypothetical protein